MGRIPQAIETGIVAPSVEKYALSFIRPYHREIARRLVLGETQADIARSLDMSESRLSIICNSPSMQKEVARLEAMRDKGVEDVATQIQELSPVALETAERIMLYGKSESLRLNAAQDILDRAGHGKVTKFDGNISVETHEQRLARLLGIRPDEVYAPKNGNKDINVNRGTDAQAMSTSHDDVVDVEVDTDPRNDRTE